MSNLAETYADRIYPIEELCFGTKLLVWDYIGVFKSDIVSKLKKGTIGTIINISDCVYGKCSDYKYKQCNCCLIALLIDGTDKTILSCHYTFRTLQGYRVARSREL